MRDDGRRDAVFPMQNARPGPQGQGKRRSRGLLGRGCCNLSTIVSNQSTGARREDSPSRNGRLECIPFTYFSWERHDAMLLLTSAFSFSFHRLFYFLGLSLGSFFDLAIICVGGIGCRDRLHCGRCFLPTFLYCKGPNCRSGAYLHGGLVLPQG